MYMLEIESLAKTVAKQGECLIRICPVFYIFGLFRLDCVIVFEIDDTSQ